MENGNTYSNGMLKWNVTTLPTSSVQVTNISTSNLIVSKGCNIKTDVINKSFKIIDPLNNTYLIGFFLNEEIVSWDILGRTIKINSSDNVSYTLEFDSSDEALIGDKRLYKIMEDFSIIDCGDENL